MQQAGAKDWEFVRRRSQETGLRVFVAGKSLSVDGSILPVKKTSSIAMIFTSWTRFSSAGTSFGGII